MLDDEAITLLAAYRDAVDSQKQAAAPATQRDGTKTHEGAELSEPSATETVVRGPAIGVGRLDAVAGVPQERFSGLHGQLLAAGYLVAELPGRAEGLTYRVTREGLQRLSGGMQAEAA